MGFVEQGQGQIGALAGHKTENGQRVDIAECHDLATSICDRELGYERVVFLADQPRDHSLPGSADDLAVQFGLFADRLGQFDVIADQLTRCIHRFERRECRIGGDSNGVLCGGHCGDHQGDGGSETFVRDGHVLVLSVSVLDQIQLMHHKALHGLIMSRGVRTYRSLHMKSEYASYH